MYAAHRSVFTEHKTLYPPKMLGVPLSTCRAVDVDYEDDFEVVKALFRKRLPWWRRRLT